LAAFHVASRLKPDPKQVEFGSEQVSVFGAPNGIQLNTREPIVKAAMLHLSRIWPKAAPFNRTVQEARALLSANGETRDVTEAIDTQVLAASFLNFYASASDSVVELWLSPPRFVVEISERPEASPLARYQARKRSHITNLKHETVSMGPFERHLLSMLDGTRGRAEMQRALADMIRDGKLHLENAGQRDLQESEVVPLIAKAVDDCLPFFASNALLVR
jgi:methyltransferase-like protein